MTDLLDKDPDLDLLDDPSGITWTSPKDNEDTAATAPNNTCSIWKTKRDATYQLFLGGPFRIAIRKALPTWPSS